MPKKCLGGFALSFSESVSESQFNEQLRLLNIPVCPKPFKQGISTYN